MKTLFTGLWPFACLILALGCSNLPESKQAQLDLFECRVQALVPAVEPVFDAAELVRDLYAGRASLPRVFQLLELGEGEVRATLERLQACEPEPQVPATVETM